MTKIIFSADSYQPKPSVASLFLIHIRIENQHFNKLEGLVKQNLQNNGAELLQLKAIFEASHDGIITVNEFGIINNINPAAAKLFQYNPADLIGNSIEGLIPDPYRSIQKNYIIDFLQSGIKDWIGIKKQVHGKRKDGTIFQLALTIKELSQNGSKLFVGFMCDNADLRQKEKELEESRYKLKAIFETAVDGIIVTDRKGRIEMVNPAISKMFGFTLEEMLGENVKMLMPEPYHSNHNGHMSRYEETRIPKIIGIGRELKGKKKDGTIFPMNLGLSEVNLHNRTVYTGIIHDLTKEKTANQQIWELNKNLEQKVIKRTAELSKNITKLVSVNKQLEHEVSERKKVEEALFISEAETRAALEKERELSELKSRFVTMASHEFRTPLSTILSSTGIISRYNKLEDKEKKEKHITRIKSAVSNLTDILNDFLSLSKIEEGKIKSHPETFVLRELCELVIDEVHGLKKPGQNIIHDSNAPDAEVYLDKRLLKNVLFNLVSNALKYSPENKPIYCNSDLKNDQLIITIKDEGIGIPKKDQVHLFTRFFRATNATNIQGTGLGLNIVRKYIELMNGQISFTSKEGEGSTFVVSVPIED